MKRIIYIESAALFDEHGSKGKQAEAAGLPPAAELIVWLYRLEHEEDCQLSVLTKNSGEASREALNILKRLLKTQGISFAGQTDEPQHAPAGSCLVARDEKLRQQAREAGLDFIHLSPSGDCQNWAQVYERLKRPPRRAELRRQTSETDIFLSINLDGSGRCQVGSGLGFLDHMLELFAKHSGIDLQARIRGDLQVDEHHTVEDTAIVLGQAIRQALGDKAGISRYGFMLPMDESLARVALDFSGRSELVWKVKFKREKIGDMPVELFYHFFKSFADNALCNLYIRARGKNEHHKIEAVFKAVARAVRMAVKRSDADSTVPSTKGVI